MRLSVKSRCSRHFKLVLNLISFVFGIFLWILHAMLRPISSHSFINFNISPKRRVIFIIARRGNLLFSECLQQVLILKRQVFIGLIELLLALQIDLIAFIMWFSLSDAVFQLIYRDLEGLPLYLRESVVDWRELLLVLRLFDHSEVPVEMSFVFLLFTQGLIPGDEEVIEHQVRNDVKGTLDRHFDVHLVLGNERVHVVVVNLGIQNNNLAVHVGVLAQIIPADRVAQCWLVAWLFFL